MTGYRGGERVLEALCELFPGAPIHTLVHVPGTVPTTIEAHPIHTSFLQKMPKSDTHYRHYLPLFPAAAESLSVKGYDLIVSTSHAVAKSVKTHGAKHWCYIHTPMRYVWDMFDDYFGPELVGKIPSKLVFSPAAAALRKYDKATCHRVTQYVANSHFVAKRVKDYYHRDAEVINPPVSMKYLDVDRTPEDFYLFFSALVPYKRADHAIAACQSLGKKLVILGHGPELKKLKRIANKNLTTFLDNPSDTVVRDHYQRAKALIFPAVEDFGIVPVEAISAGLPVIGPRLGGLMDSQTDKTCLFYEQQTVKNLIKAIEKFDTGEILFKDSDLRNKAKEFSKEIFHDKVKRSIEHMIGKEIF